MADALIKKLAMELAEQFYEQKRSGNFRSMDSTVRAKRLVVDRATGGLKEINVVLPFRRAYPTAHKYAVAHWPHFYDAARHCLVTMLAMPDKRPQHLNDQIMEALISDRDKQLKHGGKVLLQRRATPHEHEEQVPVR